MSRPRPRTSLTRDDPSAMERSFARSRSPCSTALARSCSSWIVSMTATAAAHGTGPPPNVDAWSPVANAISAGATTPRWEAPRQTLGERDHVGDDPRGGCREPVPAPTHAALHLVGDQQTASLPRERAHAAQVVIAQGMNPSLPQDRLEQDRGRGVVDRRLHRGQIVAGDVDEPIEQRLERRALRGLSRGGQRGDRSSVERPLERDDPRASATEPPLANELDRGLVRLRPGVAEEHPGLGKGQRRREELRQPRPADGSSTGCS